MKVGTKGLTKYLAKTFVGLFSNILCWSTVQCWMPNQFGQQITLMVFLDRLPSCRSGHHVGFHTADGTMSVVWFIFASLVGVGFSCLFQHLQLSAWRAINVLSYHSFEFQRFGPTKVFLEKAGCKCLEIIILDNVKTLGVLQWFLFLSSVLLFF